MNTPSIRGRRPSRLALPPVGRASPPAQVRGLNVDAKTGCCGRFLGEKICLLRCRCVDNLSNHTDSFRFVKTVGYSFHRQESVILFYTLP